MIRGRLGSASVGDALGVCVMGALNVSPESFYRGSVAVDAEQIVALARGMVEAGAGLIDVGAMSTAPYRDTAISADEEADRLGRAVRSIAREIGVPVSADTSRCEPARAALEAGAHVINDVSGLRRDPRLAELVAEADVGLILTASPVSDAAGAEESSDPPGAGVGRRNREIAGGNAETPGEEPIDVVTRMLAGGLRLAVAAGVDPSAIAVDPGIGFFRAHRIAWHEWDCRVLAALPALRRLGRPICVGVSRKSFIGALTHRNDPADRLAGSVAAAAAAVLGGAHIVRTHDVAETVQAVRVATAILRAGGGVPWSWDRGG